MKSDNSLEVMFTFLDHFLVPLLVLITFWSNLVLFEGLWKNREIQVVGSKMSAILVFWDREGIASLTPRILTLWQQNVEDRKSSKVFFLSGLQHKLMTSSDVRITLCSEIAQSE